ncbi:biotin transporter BioY [Mesorhizobium koreense]|jgi:biotin transport system substrate-specific component|uniref:biotin transporter BioY n=1 Tax=Mesorhizobium koreense TaxID=3074855 RepID=UPI00287B8594|nr:biotin transporter BioY [Mesorhizobium sp. WR6]
MKTEDTFRPVSFKPLAFLPAALRTPLLVVAGSLVMVVCAKTTVPFWPVPMTMQVFGTFLLAGIAGGRLAAAMIALYLVEGAAGLPVFANAADGGAGFLSLIGPTGGYLVAFAIAAFISGEWIRRAGLGGRVASVLPMLAGLALIYILGCLWLSQFVGWANAWMLGVLPFLPGDLLKVFLAAAATMVLSRKAWRF